MTKYIEKFIELIESGSLCDIQMFFNNLQSTDLENILNSSDVCGEYPLHVAVKANNEDVVKWLIENGADIYQTNDWGSTPIQSAMNRGYTKIHELISTTKKKPESFKEAQSSRGPHNDKSEMLNRANSTIRQANYRIEELKSLLIRKEEVIVNLEAAIEELNSITKTPSKYSKYEILGVKGAEDFIRLKKNYKALASIYHPDRCGSGSIMKVINNAYDKIK